MNDCLQRECNAFPELVDLHASSQSSNHVPWSRIVLKATPLGPKNQLETIYIDMEIVHPMANSCGFVPIG